MMMMVIVAMVIIMIIVLMIIMAITVLWSSWAHRIWIMFCFAVLVVVLCLYWFGAVVGFTCVLPA